MSFCTDPIYQTTEVPLLFSFTHCFSLKETELLWINKLTGRKKRVGIHDTFLRIRKLPILTADLYYLSYFP